MTKYKNKMMHCPIEDMLSVVGAKWSVLVIHSLMEGMKRFGQIEKELEGISPRTLSLRLAHLEATGIITKTVYAVVPPKVEYRLTQLGKKLGPVMKTMNTWGEAYRKEHKNIKSNKKRKK